MAGQQEQMYCERRHDEEESINKNVEDSAIDQVKERGIFDVLGGKKEEEQKLGHDHQVIVAEFENTYLGSDGCKRGGKAQFDREASPISQHLIYLIKMMKRKVREETRARRRRRRKQEYSKMPLMFIAMSITLKMIRRP
ncbi:hypothetical protein Syun_015089 [Stephania yunnanensis]|uniref:Uncharacterized protein n=1 Tax=Stephania yunnanensis TaxID=152371 RepID=A0AAP0PA84_9MAGN